MKFREELQNVFAENKGERQLLNAMSATVMPGKDNMTEESSIGELVILVLLPAGGRCFENRRCRIDTLRCRSV